MKVLKRAFAVTLVIVMTLSLMPMIPLSQDIASYAADESDTATEASQEESSTDGYVAEGTWGTCPWHLTQDGTLFIGAGTGVDNDYKPSDSFFSEYDASKGYPWKKYSARIKAISSEGNVILPANSSYMFYKCDSLKDISGLSNWDTSNVTNMCAMFSGCISLDDLSALSEWDTSKVTSIADLFSGCKIADTKDLSKWNMSSASSMSRTFSECTSLNDLSGLSDWDTSNVRCMDNLFIGCKSLTDVLPLSKWDTSNVGNMRSIFQKCKALNDISGISTWNVQNLELFGYAFGECEQLTSIASLSEWNTSSLVELGGTFENCYLLSDVSAISKWNLSKVSDVIYMFHNCRSIDEIDLSGILVGPRDDPDRYDMLKGCSNISKITFGYNVNNFRDNSISLEPSDAHWTREDGSDETTAEDLMSLRAPNADTIAGRAGTWIRINSKVTFDSNDGSGSIKEQIYPKGTYSSLDENKFERTGYSFSSWNTKADGSGKKYYDGQGISKEGDLYLYAQWQKIQPLQYKLQYVTNGGSAIPSETFDEDKTVDISSRTPERSGYTFTGWYSDKLLTNRITSITMNDDHVIYAGWKKDSAQGGPSGSTTYNPPSRPSASVKYELTYDTNGGSAVASEKLEKNTTVDLSSRISTREGYTFVGWYSDKDLKNRVTSVKMTSDQKVYAGWKQNAKYTDATMPDLEMEDHFAYIAGYEDGTFRPDNKITREETAAMIYRVLKSDVREANYLVNNGFADTTGNEWSNDAISTLSNMRIIKGKPGNRFAPKDNITRAEFVAILSRFSNAEVPDLNFFSDINGHWAKNDINKAAVLGWVSGRGDGAFHPDDPITRAEAVTIINKALHRQPSSYDHIKDGVIWKDNKDVWKWYFLAIQEASNSHEYDREGLTVPDERWTKITNN